MWPGALVRTALLALLCGPSLAHARRGRISRCDNAEGLTPAEAVQLCEASQAMSAAYREILRSTHLYEAFTPTHLDVLYRAINGMAEAAGGAHGHASRREALQHSSRRLVGAAFGLIRQLSRHSREHWPPPGNRLSRAVDESRTAMFRELVAGAPGIGRLLAGEGIAPKAPAVLDALAGQEGLIAYLAGGHLLGWREETLAAFFSGLDRVQDGDDCRDALWRLLGLLSCGLRVASGPSYRAGALLEGGGAHKSDDRPPPPPPPGRPAHAGAVLCAVAAALCIGVVSGAVLLRAVQGCRGGGATVHAAGADSDL